MEGASLDKPDNAWVAEAILGEFLCILYLDEFILYDLLIVNLEHFGDGDLSDEHLDGKKISEFLMLHLLKLVLVVLAGESKDCILRQLVGRNYILIRHVELAEVND
jgi:hypothetical protein